MATSRTPTQSWWKASLAVGLLFIVSVVLAATPISVSAHATLVSTDPVDGAILEDAPESLTLTFSESVSAVDGGTSLYVRGSDPLLLTPIVRDGTVAVPLPNDLADGTYALQWRVISADGHPITGTLMFSIGQPSQAADVNVPAPSTAMELGLHASVWAKYLGLLSTLGLLIGGWWYARPDWPRLVRMARWAAMLALVGAIVELPFVAAVQYGQSRWRWSSVRQLDDSALIATAIVVTGMVVFLLASSREGTLSRGISTMAVTCAALAPLLTGHTRTTSPEPLMWLADAAHLLAGSFWLGGLLILTLGLWRPESLTTFSTPESALSALSRFSAAAAWSVAVLAVSGIVMAWVILETPRDLIDTAYGRDLLIKVGLVLVVIGIAVVNRYRILPRLAADRDTSLQRLRRLVLGELVLLIAIVAVTSVLVQQNPHHVVEAAEPTVLFQGSTALDKDHDAAVIVRESGDAQVTIEVVISTIDGPMNAPVESVSAEWTLEEQGLGPITVPLLPDDTSGGYIGATTLPGSGDWTLTIRALIDRFTDSRGSVTVPVP